MKKVVTGRPSFQGELMIMRIDEIPASAKKMQPEKNGLHIIGHSETGHHHVMESRAADRFIDQMNEFCQYLDVADESTLEHLRAFDTHEPLTLEPGKYIVRTAREHTPQGWQKTID